jgi:hypothetical protein
MGGATENVPSQNQLSHSLIKSKFCWVVNIKIRDSVGPLSNFKNNSPLEFYLCWSGIINSKLLGLASAASSFWRIYWIVLFNVLTLEISAETALVT